MKCPLVTSEYIQSHDQHIESYWTDDSCDKNCAWWDKRNKCCAILTIAKKLESIKGVSNDSKAKL